MRRAGAQDDPREHEGCCQCAREPAETCRECELAYCASCSAKRHNKGAFRRHSGVAGPDREQQQDNDDDQPDAKPGDECDECQRADAVLFCRQCELSFCAACSSLTHAMGAAARHEHSGAFQYATLRDGFALMGAMESLSRSSSSMSSLSSSQATISPAGSPLYASLQALEASGDVDNQKEPSPLPMSSYVRPSLCQIDENDGAAVANASEAQPPPPTRSEEGDAFDMWSGWNAHSFGNRSESVGSAEAASEWRTLRSLSFDKTSPSQETRSSDGQLPLDSLSNSLRSLSMAQAADQSAGDNGKTESGALFASRPRSFSDYTTLRSHQEKPASWPSHDVGHKDVRQLDVTPTPASPLRDSVDELWKALKTNFATRHVLVKSVAGHFDADDIRRISDTIHNFGSVARMRGELAKDGLLFFTFHELRCAIGTVKTLSMEQSPPPSTSVSRFSPARVLSRSETIHFSLPYELPDDMNCATVVVTLSKESEATDESRVTPTVMRQFCSRFGEVASVMQTDAHSRNKFFVEFNDCRVVSAAVSSLSSMQFSFNNRPLTAIRAASPTLDVSKIQRFQECVERVSIIGPPHSSKARPKSFSSSSTSILTSPTSSVASSLNASFLEAPLSSSSTSAVAGNGKNPSSASPTFEPAAGSPSMGDERIWSRTIGGGRVRSSSMYASPSHYEEESASALAAGDRFRTMSASFTRNSLSSSQLTCATYPPTHRDSSSSQFSDQQYADYDRDVPKEDSNQFSHHFRHDKARGPPRARVDPSSSVMMSPPFMPTTKFTPLNARAGEEQPFHPSYQPSTHPINGYAYQQYGAGNTSVRPLPSQGRHDQGTGEFCLSIDRVASGEDARTTLMVRNIPNKYTQQMLLAEINLRHRGQYDFFYLPIDFKNKCNMGYAFINFMEARSIISFYREFDGQRWTNFNSEKVCAISYARLQGKQAMIARFQNSSLLEKHESYRPLVFVSSGPNRGRPEHFPAPKVTSNAPYRKHPAAPQTLFGVTSFHPQHPPHHDELFAGARAAYLAHHSQQPLQFHPSQQQCYPQQPSVLVVDPHQAQALIAAQMAAAAAIAPGRGAYRGMYDDPRYQQQQQQLYQQHQRRSNAYDSLDQRQSQGFGGRPRYS